MNEAGIHDTDRIDPTIGERITVIRRRRGIGQRELARRAHMSVTGLNRLERGLQCVTAERLATLARLLETSADYLLGLTPEDPDATQLPPWTRRQPGPVPVRAGDRITAPVG